MELLIKNVRLVDKNQDRLGDIFIENGIIRSVGRDLDFDCKIIDGKGMVILPGFIDLHAHFRDPGYSYKEDLETGSRAALRGGYTTVNLMANTNPIISSMEDVDYVLEKSRELELIDIHQTVSVTRNFNGKDLSHLKDIDGGKVKFISDDGLGILSNKTMYKAFLEAKRLGFIIMVHAEDRELTPIDYRISENIISFRDLYLSKITGGRLHLSHVSTKEAIRAIRLAKKNGVAVTCEVTPHHVAIWDEDYKVNPPIRSEEDVDEIIRGIQDGTVDAIATDHAPHTEEDKKKGAPGISGIETSFSLCYTNLVRNNKISLGKLSEIMSYRPADILGEKKGLIKEGYIADLVLVDLNEEYEIKSEDFISKGKNTPLEGTKVFGKVIKTIKDGYVRYKYN